jgi:GDP-mannose 6-dehydrogenase
MRVSVFGLGYVGSVSAASLAKAGHEVLGVDVSADKVALINAGVSPIVEPGLGALIQEVVARGRLRAATTADEAVATSDIALLCVGTPGRTNGQIDTTALERLAQQIGALLRPDRRPLTVVVRSTVLPGTTESIVVPALRNGRSPAALPHVSVAVNPEFMREGSSLRDFEEPPMTLVGCDDPATAERVRALYGGVSAPFVHTSVRTAEMVKYVSNSFHALKVAFANEIGDLCTALGTDVHDVVRLFLMDRKLNISEAYLRPGFAFGGSCLPKDLRALLHAARSADVMVPLLASIVPSNDAQVTQALQRVLGTQKRRIGVLGLAFKQGTDDLRESPIVRLVEGLIGKGCDVCILDDNVRTSRLSGANRRYIEEEIPHIASLMCDTVDALLTHAEVLVIGNPGDNVAPALAGRRPDQILIDLTRRAWS